MTTRVVANLIVVYFLQGNRSHPNEDIKVFKKHRVSDHLYTILLSMPYNYPFELSLKFQTF